MRSEPNIFR